MGEGSYADAFARIECHYFVHGAFLETDTQLLDDVHKIAHLPCVIVQGRYDVVCPATSAWDLHKRWPGSRLVIVPDAGHSAKEPGIASALQSALGTGFTVSSGTAPNSITVLDDGTAGTTDVTTLTKHTTAASLQNGDLGLNLFVDNNGQNFTDSLTGKGQKLGFAARIAVNTQLMADNKYLVQYQAGGSMGDDDRANYLLDQMSNMRFGTPQSNLSELGSFRLGGSVVDLISQTMDYTGNVAADAKGNDETQQTAVQALNQRLDNEYGVNVDEEMARLLELQNAYSANARVISAVQDLIAVYTMLAGRSDYALHLGLTEAGMGSKGIVASSAAMGVLLQQGIGDTIRVSLAADPVEEVGRDQVAETLLHVDGALDRDLPGLAVELDVLRADLVLPARHALVHVDAAANGHLPHPPAFA